MGRRLRCRSGFWKHMWLGWRSSWLSCMRLLGWRMLGRANSTFTAAAKRDVEDSPLRIVPALTAYTSAVY